MQTMTGEVGFFPHSEVANLTSILALRYPQVFEKKRLGVVGVDIPVARIIDGQGKLVEPENDLWSLPHGLYRFVFDFELPDTFRQHKIEPRMFWRSSHQRCGAGGGDFFSFSREDEDDDVSGRLLNGPVMGNYYVYNRHGIKLDKQAGMAQLCFTLHGADVFVSELLKPAKIEQFIGSGKIGREKTTLPAKIEVPKINGNWHLQKGIPYFVEFDGQVNLSKNEVLTLSKHYTDLYANLDIFCCMQYGCLGDPGYKGRLGILLVPLIPEVLVNNNTGITRLAKHRVLHSQEPLASYEGQWRNDLLPDGREIEFRNLYKWLELIGGRGMNLTEMFQHIPASK